MIGSGAKQRRDRGQRRRNTKANMLNTAVGNELLDLCLQHSLMILVLTWFYLVFHFDDHPWLLIPIPLMWYRVVLCRNIRNYQCLDVFVLHLYINCMGGNLGSILSCPFPIAEA